VTNVCNATCDFCAYARDKKLIGTARFVDSLAFAEAVPILRRRQIRHLTLQGGEPLLHPAIEALVESAAKGGRQVALITNGWRLPLKIGRLAEAGLSRLLVSLDSHSVTEHERNRGLPGVGSVSAKGWPVPSKRDWSPSPVSPSIVSCASRSCPRCSDALDSMR